MYINSLLPFMPADTGLVLKHPGLTNILNNHPMELLWPALPQIYENLLFQYGIIDSCEVADSIIYSGVMDGVMRYDANCQKLLPRLIEDIITTFAHPQLDMTPYMQYYVLEARPIGLDVIGLTFKLREIKGKYYNAG